MKLFSIGLFVLLFPFRLISQNKNGALEPRNSLGLAFKSIPHTQNLINLNNATAFAGIEFKRSIKKNRHIGFFLHKNMGSYLHAPRDIYDYHFSSIINNLYYSGFSVDKRIINKDRFSLYAEIQFGISVYKDRITESYPTSRSYLKTRRVYFLEPGISLQYKTLKSMSLYGNISALINTRAPFGYDFFKGPSNTFGLRYHFK